MATDRTTVCEACDSSHSVPLFREHWEMLRCKRPWPEWEAELQADPPSEADIERVKEVMQKFGWGK